MDYLNKVIFKFSDIPNYVDTIIVGGGLTGLQLALELWNCDPCDTIIIIEAGDILEHNHLNLVYSPEILEKMWLNPQFDTSFWRPWRSATPPHFDDRSGLRAKVGGRSLYWQGIVLPIETYAFDDVGWPRQVVEDLFQMHEGQYGLYHQMMDAVYQWSTFPITFITLDNRSKELFRMLNLDEFKLAPAMIRHTVNNNGKIFVYPYSPIELLSAISSSKERNICIFPNTYAREILFSDYTVSGLAVETFNSRAQKEIKCNKIVLCAGAIENSRLALQAYSKIGNNTRKARYLYDHIVQGFMVKIELDRFPKMAQRLLQPGPVYYLEGSKTERTNSFISFSSAEEGSIIVDMWCIGEQLPTRDNFVHTINNNVPFQTEISIGYSNEDLDVIRKQQQKMDFVWKKICDFIGHKHNTLKFYSFGDLKNGLPLVVRSFRNSSIGSLTPLTWINPLGTVDHEGCCLSFGKHIKSNNEFYEISNLFCHGSCTFPRMGAANPTFTNLALSRRIARILSLI